MGYAAAWGLAWARFPARVPVHFGAGGEVDRYADRGSALVGFAVLGVVLTALFVVLACAGSRVPTTWLNLPHRDHWLATPERERQVRAMMAVDLAALGAATLVLLAALLTATAVVSTDTDPRLGAPVAILVAVWLVLVLGYAVWCHRRRYRP